LPARSGQAGHFIFFRPSSSRNQSQLYFFGSSFERRRSRFVAQGASGMRLPSLPPMRRRLHTEMGAAKQHRRQDNHLRPATALIGRRRWGVPIVHASKEFSNSGRKIPLSALTSLLLSKKPRNSARAVGVLAVSKQPDAAPIVGGPGLAITHRCVAGADGGRPIRRRAYSTAP
jgi:hypothetical protein